MSSVISSPDVTVPTFAGKTGIGNVSRKQFLYADSVAHCSAALQINPGKTISLLHLAIGVAEKPSPALSLSSPSGVALRMRALSL